MVNDPTELPRQQIGRALFARDRADISWLPLLEKDRWALAADALKFIDTLVREVRPKHIIEFGAGYSTEVFARACGEMKIACAISSIDHDPQFGISNARRIVESFRNVTLTSQIAPLVARDYGCKLLPTYFWDRSKLASREPADLVLIDGPPMNLGGREGILYQVLGFCHSGTIVLLDDSSRPSERIATRNWQDTLGPAIEVLRLRDFARGMIAVLVRQIVKVDELWDWRLVRARQQIEAIVSPRSTFVLIEFSNFGSFAGNRCPWPLMRRGSEYWGAPASSESAISELEARRCEGATHFVLPWTAFWWTDYYADFIAHLRKQFRCAAGGDLLLAFDLRHSRSDGRDRSGDSRA